MRACLQRQKARRGFARTTAPRAAYPESPKLTQIAGRDSCPSQLSASRQRRFRLGTRPAKASAAAAPPHAWWHASRPGGRAQVHGPAYGESQSDPSHTTKAQALPEGAECLSCDLGCWAARKAAARICSTLTQDMQYLDVHLTGPGGRARVHRPAHGEMTASVRGRRA